MAMNKDEQIILEVVMSCKAVVFYLMDPFTLTWSSCVTWRYNADRLELDSLYP